MDASDASGAGHLKVLHVVPAYHPSQGGIETLVRSMVRHLRGSGSWRFCVLVAIPVSDNQQGVRLGDLMRDSLDGIDVIRLAVPAFEEQVDARATLAVISSVRKVMAVEKPDVVHSHAFSLLTIPVETVARTRGVPLLWHIHGGITEEYSPALLERIRDTFHLVVPSEYVKKEIEVKAGREHPTHVVLNGIDLDECEQVLAAAERGKTCDVAMVGRLEELKGFHVALAALAGLGEIRIKIVGRGPMEVELKQQIHDLGLQAQVELLGELGHAQTLRVMAGASLVLVPSLTVEGFGLVAAEAGALGVPVVASRMGGLAEVVEDGVTGTLVDPGSESAIAGAVQRYLEDRDLRMAHGRMAGIRVRKRFGIDRWCASMLAMYSELCKD